MRPLSQCCLFQEAPEATTWAGAAGLAVLAFAVITVAAASQQGAAEEEIPPPATATTAEPQPDDASAGAFQLCDGI